MPRVLLVLIVGNVAGMALAGSIYLVRDGRAEDIVRLWIIAVVLVPTAIVFYYLQYLLLWLYVEAYWWLAVIGGVLTALFVIYAILGALFGFYALPL